MKPKTLLKLWPYGLDALMGFLWCCSLTPYQIIPLFWLCLFYFFERLERAPSPKAAALIGWAFGIGFCWSAYYWMVHTLYNFGQLPIPIAILIATIYNCVFATEYLLLGLLLQPTLHKFRERPWLKLFWASVFFVFLDGFFPQHFPHAGSLLFAPYPFWLQTADLWGDLGVAWILYLSAIGLWLVIKNWQRQKVKALQYALPTVVAIIVFSAYGFAIGKKWQNHSPQEFITLAGIQANIGNLDKIESSRDGNPDKKAEVLRRYLSQSMTVGENQVDLIVWPETAFPGYISYSKYTPYLLEAAAQLKTDFLVGGLDAVKDNNRAIYYNGMFLINHQDKKVEHSYYKRVLLAFGEFIPFSSFFPSLKKMVPAIGQFTPGPGPEVIAWKDKLGTVRKLGVSICYEAIVPRFVNGLASLNPDIFINITNDSWYGNTREPYFHFHLQAMRAIEYRRYLFRLANTGFSAVVSPYGTISQRTQMNVPKTLVAKVPLVSENPTVYNQFGFWGLRILILILTALGLFRISPLLRR